MKTQDIILLAALGLGGYLIYKEFLAGPSRPPVREDLPPNAQSQPNWQKWLMLMPVLIGLGLNAYNTINEAIQQGKTPEELQLEIDYRYSEYRGAGGTKSYDEWIAAGGPAIGAGGKPCWYDLNTYRSLCDTMSAENCYSVV